MNPSSFSRRTFLAALAAAGALPGALPGAAFGGAAARPPEPQPLCVFTKPLEWLSYADAAALAAETGFEGLDLTVRPGGHVDPARVEEDLPRAVAAARAAGLATPMMVTAITDASDPAAERTLRTAAALGVRYYRMGYLPYDKALSPAAHLAALRPQMAELADLNRRYGMHGAYQNHAGARVGGSVWDLHLLLDGIDPAHLGVQYDIRHAMVEGATAWPVALRLVAPRVRTLAIKDFRWEQRDGKWQPVTVALGEGMVDFPAFLTLVRQLGIAGPFTLHYEYPLAEQPEANLAGPERLRQYRAAMQRDAALLRRLQAATSG